MLLYGPGCSCSFLLGIYTCQSFLCIIYTCISVIYTQIFIIILKGKINHKFESKQGEIYEKAFQEEEESRNYAIIISKLI